MICVFMDVCTPSCARASACEQVFYLNTAKSNLFNGPLLQYFESEGIDGPYATDDDFGRTGRFV